LILRLLFAFQEALAAFPESGFASLYFCTQAARFSGFSFAQR
jgi:hypothetical protein